MLNLRASEVRRFWRAGLQHRDVARRLLDSSDAVRSIEARWSVYIGGYAVECGLKSLILSSMAAGEHRNAVEELLPQLGHNLVGCRDHLISLGSIRVPTELSDRIRTRIASVWSVTMRYEPGKLDRRLAGSFLAGVDEFIAWVEG